jgi:hypothetical protein
VKITAALDKMFAVRAAKPHARRDGFDAHLEQASRDANITKQPAPRAARVAKPADDASIDGDVASNVTSEVAVAKPEASAEAVTAPPAEPPVLLAAICHAIAALRATPSQTPAPAIAIEAPADQPAIPSPSLTPLEQAVHDMLAELAPVRTPDPGPREEHRDEPAAPVPANTNAPIATAPAPAHAEPAPRATHAAAPPPALCEIQAQEMPIAQSHVHLVVGDDAERVVVTVAVRGNDVNVALRAGDDHTTAALARNAGALDHALRTRGLDLSSFSAERDPDRRRREQPHREQPPEPQQPFVLEQT